MYDAFISHIQQSTLFEHHKRYLLACSGGLDSMALAHLLHAAGIQVELAHVNFGLRGTESDGDEDVFKKKNTPQLSDIQVISNEVVYDSANNPTAKIVFKVKNSSGELLKAVNVKVEKK